jgi:hypothetical protein
MKTPPIVNPFEFVWTLNGFVESKIAALLLTITSHLKNLMFFVVRPSTQTILLSSKGQ